MNITKNLSFFALSTLSACSSEPPNSLTPEPNIIEITEEIVTERDKIKHSIEVITLTQEEIALEALRQKSYQEDFLSRGYPEIYGNELYSSEELLSPEFNIDEVYEGTLPELRLHQFFLRNGREQTFSHAEELECQHHKITLTANHPITQLFKEAGIDLEGENIDWLEGPESMRSGSLTRLKERYGGQDEAILVVAKRSNPKELAQWIEVPANQAGYPVDPQKEFQSKTLNEMSHEILRKYFPELFLMTRYDTFTEPFKSFESRVPGLRFKSNIQAEEFLSDVISRDSGGVYYRFFNPLYYMDENSPFYGGEDNQYAYSYAIQRYAMEVVLREKGYQNAKAIVDQLIQLATESKHNHKPEFAFAKQHFQEDDFERIAEIYKEIGLGLLKEMKAYHEKPERP